MRELGVDTGGAEPWAQALVGMGLSTGEWWLERQTMSRAAVGALPDVLHLARVLGHGRPSSAYPSLLDAPDGTRIHHPHRRRAR